MKLRSMLQSMIDDRQCRSPLCILIWKAQKVGSGYYEGHADDVGADIFLARWPDA